LENPLYMDGSVDQPLSPPMTSSVPLAPPPSIDPPDTLPPRTNQVGTVILYGVPIVSLHIDNVERLCLAQISNTLLKQEFSYNEIHNRRVALGITCVQCTPVQLEILRRAGAMPISSRRCGMITKREAERLCKSFLGDNTPPKLPDNFAFDVVHECNWGCRGSFVPSRYNSSRAKCIKCFYCAMFFSPNKFVFHSHRLADSKYVQPDAANFNSWRRHIRLWGDAPTEVQHAWEDVKAMFNGGTRKRLMAATSHAVGAELAYPPPYLAPLPSPYPAHHKDARQTFVDYLWGSRTSLPPLGLPYPLAAWPRRPLPSFPPLPLPDPRSDATTEVRITDLEPPALRAAHLSAFTPVARASPTPQGNSAEGDSGNQLPDSSRYSDDENIDIEVTEEDQRHRNSKSYDKNDFKYEMKYDLKHDLYKTESSKADSLKPDDFSISTTKHGLDLSPPPSAAPSTDNSKIDYQKDDLSEPAQSDGGDCESSSSPMKSRDDGRSRERERERRTHSSGSEHTKSSNSRHARMCSSPTSNTANDLGGDVVSRPNLEVSTSST
ncbi:c-SKI Smad4 binding domain, partial [Halocaridina rubra]